MAQLSDYEKAGRIVNDGGFIVRVRAAIIKISLDVKGEAYTTVVVTGINGAPDQTLPSELSRKRASLADQVLQSPSVVAERFTNVLAVAPGIVTKYATIIDADPDSDGADETLSEQVKAAVRQILDADIEWTVSSVWDDIAGVNGWDSGQV